MKTTQVYRGMNVILAKLHFIQQGDFDKQDDCILFKILFAGVDFLQVSCSENGELDLAHLGPVTNLAELGCDKQYRWIQSYTGCKHLLFYLSWNLNPSSIVGEPLVICHCSMVVLKPRKSWIKFWFASKNESEKPHSSTL